MHESKSGDLQQRIIGLSLNLSWPIAGFAPFDLASKGDLYPSSRPAGGEAIVQMEAPNVLDLYTYKVYIVIHTVELSALARKQLTNLPLHIVVSFQNWVEDVEERGLEEVRKIAGYHDEPLRGKLRGLRSIRLSRAYRAYYRVKIGQIRFVNVERIDKHEY